MPSRDANGNWVYSQAEYDHFNFTSERFSGLVEGIGYTCTDIVVTASPINASGTQFMFDFNIISYVFDMSDMSYNYEPTLSDTKSQQDSNTPDRSDYVKIPNAPKFEYGDRSWYNPMNIATFVDNVVIDLVNPLIDVVNTVPISAQLVYNEGWGALGSELYDAGKAVMRTPYDYVKGNYNYIANTPASQQWSDFKRDMSNPHTYEQGVAMGIGIYCGGRSLGVLPQAKIPNLVSIQTNAPQYVRIHNYYIKPLRASGSGKLSGFTISKSPKYGAQTRFDFEKILGASRETSRLTIPNFLKNKPLPHWHRGKGNNLRYHRPWEIGPDGKRRW